MTMPSRQRQSYRQKRSSTEMAYESKEDSTLEPRSKRKRKSKNLEMEIEYVPRRGRSSSKQKSRPDEIDLKYTLESSANQTSPSNEMFASEVKKKSNSAEAEIGQKSVRRRGRLPSSLPCPNQRAKLARENRRKKNEYIQKIENKLELLEKENKVFSDVVEKQKADIKRLEAEVVYLKSVLHSKKKINGLLKSMNANLQKFRVAEEEEESFKAIHELNLAHDFYEKDDSIIEESTAIFDNWTPLDEIEMVDFSTLGSLFPNEEIFMQNLESSVEFCPDMNP
ncbi:uncharacterized protein LOC117173306 [Belonocnema kinseyi]|uniref:uncharacterized protein LOC117173306 n=1 Tax=Belonocnema kinseyi TaxID=2817044 RepID=UPI00143DFFFF|nr:uncharacterized protein LOC117173306 [Belonocnema kinseyi]